MSKRAGKANQLTWLNGADRSLTLLQSFIQEQRELPPQKNTQVHFLFAKEPGSLPFCSNERTGKWCLFYDADTVEQAWTELSALTRLGQLSMLAKCSTLRATHAHNGDRINDYVICVYLWDVSDQTEVEQVKLRLRRNGFTGKLYLRSDEQTKNKEAGFLRIEPEIEAHQPSPD